MEAESIPYRTESWVPLDTFGTRLLVMRRELGLTQKEAADACGLDDGSWSNWENGTRCRNLIEVVDVIARTFNVRREWLMWGAMGESTSARLSHVPGQGQLALAWSQDETDHRFAPSKSPPLLSVVPSLDHTE